MRVLDTPKPVLHLSGCGAPMWLTTKVYELSEGIDCRAFLALDGTALPISTPIEDCPVCGRPVDTTDFFHALKDDLPEEVWSP